MIANVLIALIRVYQWTLSRLLLALFGPVCRFEPSCSRYAVACLAGQGALRGSLLSVKRLCKCHPFHPGGYDPPPPPLPGRRIPREDKPYGDPRKKMEPTDSEDRAALAGLRQCMDVRGPSQDGNATL
jgi:uncharacterized protein